MQFEGADEARRAIEAHLTPRARYLDTLERYVEGTQYLGLRPWDDGEVPLRQRAPCIVYLLAKAAIESNEDLLLGDHRFPEITSNPGEEDDALEDDDAGEGLSEEDSSYLDRVITEIERVASFGAACREAFSSAQATGTAVTVAGVRGTRGRLFVDTIPSKWCERELDADGNVIKLTIQYPFEHTFVGKDGKWHVEAMLYRRVIDDKSDTTMLPAKATAEPKAIDWQPDPAQTFEHDLGFCPVVWYAHMQGCTTAEQIDGKALHRVCLDEIRELDYALSQRHSAALYTGSPQLVEIGVEPGHNPSSTGQTAVIPATPLGGPLTSLNKPTAGYIAGPKDARKKGVSIAWQYPREGTKVDYLTIPGDATEVLDKDAQDIRQKIAEMLCVVFMDPENVKFAATLSAKAIEVLLRRQLNRIDKYRDDFGESLIIRQMSMLLRLVCKLTSANKAVALRGRKKLAAILGDGGPNWVDPMLFLKWGPYFKPNAEDQSKILDATIKARSETLITLQTAVEQIAPIFGIENVDEYVDNLEEQAEAAQAKALGMMQAQKDSEAESDEESDEDDEEAETPPPKPPAK